MGYYMLMTQKAPKKTQSEKGVFSPSPSQVEESPQNVGEWKKVEMPMPPLYGPRQFQNNNTLEGLFLRTRTIRTRFGERRLLDLDVNGKPVAIVMTANLERQVDYLLQRNLLPIGTPIRVVYKGKSGRIHLWELYIKEK